MDADGYEHDNMSKWTTARGAKSRKTLECLNSFTRRYWINMVLKISLIKPCIQVQMVGTDKISRMLISYVL